MPTPDEYARLYWHARELAARQLRRELQQLRAAAARPVTGYDPDRVIELARILADRITPDPPHVIAARRRAIGEPHRPDLAERNAQRAARRRRQKQKQRTEGTAA